MSSLRESTSTFERVAFESALRCHPGDTTAKAVFIDWLMEHGYTPIGARREATRIVREEVERRQCERVRAWVEVDRSHLVRLIREIYLALGIHLNEIPTITIVPGGALPLRTQEAGEYVASDGSQWRADPEDDMSLEHTSWVPTAVTITVGAAWVRSRIGNI